MRKSGPPAGIYCRISEDRPGTGLGVERQRQDCEKLAAAKGWQVADTYIDNDISAYSGKVRPEYRRLLTDLEQGTIRAVVVWHLDRLHRQPKELESFIDLVQAKGVLLASVSGDTDLATPEGRLYARMLGAVARMESEHKSRRIKRAFLEKAKAGDPWVNGHRPYGFADGGTSLDPHEAQVIRDCVKRIIAGESLRSVCLDLNRSGDRTSEGNEWIQRSLKRVLIRARNAGFREHSEIGLVKGKWPPILSEQDWRRVTAILTDPVRYKRTAGPPRRHLLSGILRCGECGKKLAAGPNRVYICLPPPQGCHRVSITRNWVDEFIAESVIEALQNPDISNGGSAEAGDEAALKELAEDNALLEELAKAYSARKVTMSEWLTARAPIEARINAAQTAVAESSRTRLRRQLANDGTNLRELWPSLTVEKQRAIIESVIDHIVVKRVGLGHYKETSRLVPAWKH
jgi:DNA invertase Pin-like site-specific DNA recombinase